MFEISVMDMMFFIAYIIAVLLIGILAGRKKDNSADSFFMARGTIPWYAVGFSMIATSISTEQFIGASAKAHDVGMAVMNWEWGIVPAFTLLVFVFLPLYYRRKVFTIPEYLERRYNPATRTIFSLMTLVSYFAVNLAGVLYSGGYLLYQVFGLPLVPAIWGLAFLTGIYTIYGGLVSVVWTETLQSILLLAGGAFITIMGLTIIPGGFMGAVGTGARAHLILPLDHPELPWSAILVLVFSTNVWYVCTNQFYIQMSLGAKNEWHARMGIVFAIFLGILLGFAVEFTGIVGYRLVEIGYMPAPPESNAIYPYLIRHIVPAGIRGIVFAGIIAAIMSTISALVHSISTLFSMDIYRVYIKPETSERGLVKVGQFVGALLLACGALIAPVVGWFPTIFDFFQQCWAVMAAPIAVVFLFGALWKRATTIAAVSTLLLGIVAIPVTFMLQSLEAFNGMNYYSIVAIIYIVEILWMIVVSIMTEPPGEEAVSAVWQPSLVHLLPGEHPEPYRWFTRISLWWGVAAVAIGALYIIFW